MGLDTLAKGLNSKNSYRQGYITFMRFRLQLAVTYNKEFGELYSKWMNEEIAENECKRMNEICNDDLNLFLEHSDCDGRFTPKECKKIYGVIKDLKMDMQGYNYRTKKAYNMLEQWKTIFKHCYQKRVNLYFVRGR